MNRTTQSVKIANISLIEGMIAVIFLCLIADLMKLVVWFLNWSIAFSSAL